MPQLPTQIRKYKACLCGNKKKCIKIVETASLFQHFFITLHAVFEQRRKFYKRFRLLIGKQNLCKCRDTGRKKSKNV